MALPNISEFRAKLKYGGARNNLFYVKITNPVVGGVDSELSFKCHAASLPAWEQTAIQVPYMGRQIKVAGNKTFGDWNVSIYNDEDFAQRDALETWSNRINSLEGNVRTLASSEQALYKSVAEVIQVSQTGKPLRSYKFSGIFPTQISPIQLEWGDDNVERFDVTFSIDYFYVDNTTTGTAGGR